MKIAKQWSLDLCIKLALGGGGVWAMAGVQGKVAFGLSLVEAHWTAN